MGAHPSRSSATEPFTVKVMLATTGDRSCGTDISGAGNTGSNVTHDHTCSEHCCEVEVSPGFSTLKPSKHALHIARTRWHLRSQGAIDVVFNCHRTGTCKRVLLTRIRAPKWSTARG